MRLDVFATAEQYREHLRPVWDEFEPNERGLWVERRPQRRDEQPRGDIALVASYSDYKNVCGTRLVTTRESASVLRVNAPHVPIVMMEHGAGFTYLPNPRKPNWGGSYAGGPSRDHVKLFPSTNRWVREANLRAQPNVPAPIVGCPKLDALTAIPEPGNDHPVIAFSFHWECPVWPETRSAFPHYQEGLAAFAAAAAERGWEVLGHGHPRVQAELRYTWRKLGWEPVTAFEAVCRKADVYVCDTSSTIYEFAALGRPVVVLNAPWYRRDVQHGLRFWSHADVGVNCEQPEDLVYAVELALEDDVRQRGQREQAVNEVYPYLGESAARTAAVIRDFYEELHA